MRSSHTLDRLETRFDDDRPVADAGLLLPATLVHHLGLKELVARRPGGVPAGLVGLLRRDDRFRSRPLVVPTAVGAGDEQVLALQLFEARDGLSRWHQLTSDWAGNEDRWHGDSPSLRHFRLSHAPRRCRRLRGVSPPNAGSRRPLRV